MKKNKAPLISIYIPSYNHEPYLEFCLESLKNLTYENTEIIFSDDCSTDNSVKKAQSFNLKNMKILESTENLGPSLNFNKGIQISNGDYIAVCCSDDGFYPEKLSLQMEEFKKKPDLGAIFTIPTLIDGQNQILPNEIHPLYFIDKPTNQYEWLLHFLLHGNCLLGSSMLIKKECFDKIGLYDPRYLQLQDFEFYIRLCLAGYEISVMNTPLIYYRHHDNNITNQNSEKKQLRLYNEGKHIKKTHFSNIKNPQLIQHMFPKIKENHIALMQYDMALILANYPGAKFICKDILYTIYNDISNVNLLMKERQFYPNDLYKYTSEIF